MNPSDARSPEGAQNTPPASDDFSSRTQSESSAMAETAKRDLEEVKEQAASDMDALRRGAGEQVSVVTDKAKSFAEEQKNFLAGQIDSVANAVSRVADELDRSEQSTVARYARDLAGGLSTFGSKVEGNDVDHLIANAQTFGRQQPLAFLGAAALAGFVASRFAVASAHRSQQSPAPASGRSDGSPAYPEGDQ